MRPNQNPAERRVGAPAPRRSCLGGGRLPTGGPFRDDYTPDTATDLAGATALVLRGRTHLNRVWIAQVGGVRDPYTGVWALPLPRTDQGRAALLREVVRRGLHWAPTQPPDVT
jgi:hypothetical protein